MLRLPRSLACGPFSWARVTGWAAGGGCLLAYGPVEPVLYAPAAIALLAALMNAFPRLTLHEHGIFDGLHFFNLHSLQLHSFGKSPGVPSGNRLTLKGTRLIGTSFWVPHEQTETLDRFLEGAIRNRELLPADRIWKLLLSYSTRLGISLLLWLGWQWFVA
ncbi:MAG: hypothetical protein AAGG44_17610 [Planctomycetota bacterium]